MLTSVVALQGPFLYFQIEPQSWAAGWVWSVRVFGEQLVGIVDTSDRSSLFQPSCPSRSNPAHFPACYGSPAGLLVGVRYIIMSTFEHGAMKKSHIWPQCSLEEASLNEEVGHWQCLTHVCNPLLFLALDSSGVLVCSLHSVPGQNYPSEWPVDTQNREG